MYLLNMNNYDPSEIIWDEYDWSDMNEEPLIEDDLWEAEHAARRQRMIALSETADEGFEG